MQKIKSTVITILAAALTLLPILPSSALAAGIAPSGGGSKVVGQSFQVKIVASGAQFDSLQGTISVSGPVTASVSAGSATWLPGKAPSNGGQFVGIVSPTTSLTVATLTLKGTKEGKGSVTVSGVSLARNGSYVGTSGGTVSFTIGRAPTPPGAITVSSTSHPDQAQAYEATTVDLQWTAPSNGATGYSYVFNETADTNPESKVNITETTLRIENATVAEHYFHIKAVNGDGWGSPTHFKVTIKEPDAKIDPTLSTPVISSIEKSPEFATNIETGTLKGVTIKGTGALTGYTIIVAFDPKDRLPATLMQPIPVATDTEPAVTDPATTPEATTPTATEPIATETVVMTPLMAKPDENGSWQVTVNEAIPAGVYKITAQGIKEKTLTPLSSVLTVEFSLAKGGDIRILTAADATSPNDRSFRVLGVVFSSTTQFYLFLAILVLLGAVIWLSKRLIVKSWPFWPFKKKTTSVNRLDS